jgi:hypothetical protein
MKTSELILRLQKCSQAGEDYDVRIETRASGYDISNVYRFSPSDDSQAQVFLVLMPNERKQRTQRSPTTEPSALDSLRSA